MTLNIIKNHKYGLLIFGILALFMVSKSNHSLDEDIVISYVIDYKTGFGPRKLIASIVSAIWEVPTIGKIRFFAYTLSTLLCALFAWICDFYINRKKELGQDAYISALYQTALYLTCPASILFLLKYPNVGRLDIVLYGLCLVFAVIFYNRDKHRTSYYITTTLLLCIGILTHHIFVATYMAFMAALFIYDIWEMGFSKKRFLSYCVVGAISVSVLLSVLSLASMNIPLDEATHYNPHMELSRKFVCFGYYAHISDHIEQYFIPKWPRLAAGFTLTIAILSPLFLAVWKIWRDLKNSLSQKADRQLLIGVLCSFLLFVPAFCITVDYLRWFGAFIFIQFLLIGYFSFDAKTKFRGVGDVVKKNLKSYIFYAAFLVIYCASFDYFTSDTYFDVIEMIMEKLHIYRVETLLPVEYRI